MRPAIRLIAAAGVAALGGGCQTIIYHVAEPPGSDGIFVLRADGSDTPAGPAYATGRAPHVAPDGSVLFVKSSAAAGTQVFRDAQQLTDSAGDKRLPAASTTAYAYVHDIPGGGPHVVVRQNSGADQLLFAADATGLAFYDNGRELVFTLHDGVYSTPSSGIPAPTRVAPCLTTPPSGCGPLAVSHDGRHLAYSSYVLTGPGRIGHIDVLRIDRWVPLLRIVPGDFCPQCPPGQPGTPEQFGSFDFSPSDDYLYVTVRVAGPGSGATARNRDELFRIKLHLAGSPPSVSAPERLTNNTYPDYHPSTKLQPGS